MQKFTEFVKEYTSSLKHQSKIEKSNRFNELYERKLKEYGVLSPLELSESDSIEFYAYLKNLSESELINDTPLKKDVDHIEEKDVKDKKSFKEYAESVLRKAHGDKYDQKIADEVIDDLSKKVKDDDWGAAVGRLTSGLGE